MAVAPTDSVVEVRKGFTVVGVGVVDAVAQCFGALFVRVDGRHIRVVPFAEVSRVDTVRRRVELRPSRSQEGGER